MAANGDRPESGFELDGEFYRLTSSDMGKDLMLIDRLTAMPMEQFFEIAGNFDGLRGPVALALIATSIRAAHPDWSVERIYRIVSELHLGTDVEWIGGELEDDPELPPAEAVPQAGGTAPESSPSTSDGSSSSSTPTDSSSSETSSVIPA